MENINCLILLVAGRSTRFGMDVKKQFLTLNGKPVFIHTLLNLMKFPFERVVIAYPKEDKEDVAKYIEEYKDEYKNAEIEFVEGGENRVKSVYNCMEYLNEKNPPKYVFIHDGVRPNVREEDLDNLTKKLKEKKAAILAIKITDTVKKVDEYNKITETIERTSLYRAATPQAFIFSHYYRAIKRYVEIEKMYFTVTDDAEIYNRYAGDVYVVECGSSNVKITTVHDLNLVFGRKQR